MPTLSKAQLLERVRAALAIAGFRCLQHGRATDHPFRLSAVRDDQVYRLILYIWNVTHGGGDERPANEYRIQMTGVLPPLVSETEHITLLLGWRDEDQVLAAFDPRRHRHFTAGSPSIQIKEETLEEAAANGIAFHDKGSGEIAIAFRPDFLLFYIQHRDELHDLGADASALARVEDAARKGMDAGRLFPDQPERASALAQIRRWQRSADFRRRVLSAYGYHCAVCEQQLDMTVAAHIVPVSETGSTDETSNGIALCPDHHQAYDAGLVGILPSYSVAINPERVHQLEQTNMADGLAAFRSKLLPSIILPAAINERPRRDLLATGLALRGWLDAPERLLL